jgi:hypothetical protein
MMLVLLAPNRRADDLSVMDSGFLFGDQMWKVGHEKHVGQVPVQRTSRKRVEPLSLTAGLRALSADTIG